MTIATLKRIIRDSLLWLGGVGYQIPPILTLSNGSFILSNGSQKKSLGISSITYIDMY